MQALDAERRALEIIADAAGDAAERADVLNLLVACVRSFRGLTLDQLRSVLHSNWCGMELIAEAHDVNGGGGWSCFGMESIEGHCCSSGK